MPYYSNKNQSISQWHVAPHGSTSPLSETLSPSSPLSALPPKRDENTVSAIYVSVEAESPVVYELIITKYIFSKGKGFKIKLTAF